MRERVKNGEKEVKYFLFSLSLQPGTKKFSNISSKVCLSII